MSSIAKFAHALAITAVCTVVCVACADMLHDRFKKGK